MKAWTLLKRLHRDERGAEGLEKLLIIAAIVLPLLGILIYFSKDIMVWVKGIWETAKGGAPTVDDTLKGTLTP
jgi:Flp pilus assembly pilin Flp